jgi:uncharacterized protein (DUF2336 family)
MPQAIDTEYLFQLARDKSAEGRAVLARIISDLFDKQGDALSDRERGLIFNILHGIIHDIEVSVRGNLSQRLAALPDVPRELITVLANDAIDVSYPVLSKSTVLRDTDLIDVIRLRSLEHQLAVTLRTEISEEVSDVLVETAEESVVGSLLKNQNARISESTMEYLVEQSRRVNTYQEPLLHRNDLNSTLAKRMFMWVSAALRQHIVNRYEIDPETVDHLLEEAALEEIDKTAATRETGNRGAEKLAATLKSEGMVTPKMLVAALTDGEVPLFLAMFAEVTCLNEYLAARIVFEAGGEGLAIACKALDFPEFEFATIFNMSRKTRPNTKRNMKADLRKVLELYRNMTTNAAQAVLHRWQRGSDYLAAIRELNG